jgi:hypothetical protein
VGSSPFPGVSLADLAQRFAPITRLHPLEQYLPSSTDWYLEKVDYVHWVDGNDWVMPPPWWTNQSPFPYAGDNNADYFAIPGDDGVNPDPPPAVAYIRDGDITTATAYVHAVPVYFDQDGSPGTWLDLQYWLFYAFNGAESIVVVDDEGDVYTEPVTWSFHEADWECVTVRINAGQQVVGAGFSQHSGVQWVWTPGTGFQVQGDQVVSYVANGSHANYTDAGGPYWIASKTVNDAQVGLADWVVWQPTNGSQQVDYSQSGRTLVVADDTGWFGTLPAPPSWLTFEGHWGMPAAVPITYEELDQGIAAAIDAIVPSWLATILIAVGVPALLAAVVVNTIGSTGQEGPANLPQQGGWRSQPQVMAAAFDGNAWSAFPMPGIAAGTSPSCATEQVNGLLDIHAVYQDLYGFPCYVHFTADTGTWSPPARVGTVQCDTAPAIAVFNGTCYCVFAVGALLYCSVQNDESLWPPATNMKNNGIAADTFPALFVQGNVLYCVYQAYGSGRGNGQLLCMTLQPNASAWVQQNPQKENYFGMSFSPAAAPGSTDGTYVIYQGYEAHGYLSASSVDASGWHQSVSEFSPPLGWPAAYMTSAPAAAFWQNALYAACQGTAGNPIFAVVTLNVTAANFSLVRGPQNALTPVGTPPSLLAYGDSLLCFWVALPM